MIHVQFHISVLSKATYVLMNKNNEAFYFKCPKCPTVVPHVELMAYATSSTTTSHEFDHHFSWLMPREVVKNARATLAETCKLTLGPLHSSPNKHLHPRPATHSTDVIPFTPIDGICLPMITPEIELANAWQGFRYELKFKLNYFIYLIILILCS